MRAQLLPRLLLWLTRNRPCRLIHIDGQPYLERHYMGRWFGRYVYLHRFVRDDHERAVHDHPWRRAGALVLTGHYTEERAIITCRGVFRFRQQIRWFNRIERGATYADTHRITATRPETWTLFWHGAWVFPWGFYDLQRTAPPLSGAIDVTASAGQTPSHLPLIPLYGPEYVGRYTEHKPRPTSEQDRWWWLFAPRARDIGREPLRR